MSKVTGRINQTDESDYYQSNVKNEYKRANKEIIVESEEGESLVINLKKTSGGSKHVSVAKLDMVADETSSFESEDLSNSDESISANEELDPKKLEDGQIQKLKRTQTRQRDVKTKDKSQLKKHTTKSSRGIVETQKTVEAVDRKSSITKTQQSKRSGTLISKRSKLSQALRLSTKISKKEDGLSDALQNSGGIFNGVNR